jgi:hypothetical protein
MTAKDKIARRKLSLLELASDLANVSRGCRGWSTSPVGRRHASALWPPGTFARAYSAKRRAAIEDAIDADPLAACVRELMAERGSWRGSAADLLRIGADRSNDGSARGGTGWPKNPRALAGRLRRAQTLLRALGIEIAFSREGRAGSRVIRICGTAETTVSTVSSVPHNESQTGSRQPRPGPRAIG